MNLDELLEKSREYVQKYPHLRHEIMDFYAIACDEVDAGESESNECSLALRDIEELIEEEEEENQKFIESKE